MKGISSLIYKPSKKNCLESGIGRGNRGGRGVTPENTDPGYHQGTTLDNASGYYGAEKITSRGSKD